MLATCPRSLGVCDPQPLARWGSVTPSPGPLKPPGHRPGGSAAISYAAIGYARPRSLGVCDPQPYARWGSVTPAIAVWRI